MVRAKYWTLVIWMLSFLPTLTTRAQEYRFHHYGRKDGLGNDFAASLQEDSLGYIWVHYYGVLSRFDGYGFKTFKYNADDTTRAAINFMLGGFIGGHNNDVWIQEHKQKFDSAITLARYDQRRDAFIRYDIIADLRGERINKYLFEGSKGLWLGSSGMGLFYHNFSSGFTERYFNRTNDSSHYIAQNATLGFKDQNSEILMGTARGLWIFNKVDKTFSRPKCDPKDTTLLYQGWTRILDDQHTPHTWLRVMQTLVRIDSNYRIVQTYELPKDVIVGSYDIDADGIIWFGGSK